MKNNCRPGIASKNCRPEGDQEKVIASKKNRNEKKHITIFMMTIRHINVQGRVQWDPNSSALLFKPYVHYNSPLLGSLPATTFFVKMATKSKFEL